MSGNGLQPDDLAEMKDGRLSLWRGGMGDPLSGPLCAPRDLRIANQP